MVAYFPIQLLAYGKKIVVNVPDYHRPKIKNASGPYSDENGTLDLVDFLVGSEGIFGLITSATFRLKEMPDEYLDLFFTLPSEQDAILFHRYIQDFHHRIYPHYQNSIHIELNCLNLCQMY